MGTLYRNNIKYGGGGSGGSIFHNYSTEEKVVGKWIDGETLYEKTINVDLSTQHSSSYNPEHGIPNVNQILNIDGFVTKDGHGYDSINSYASPSWFIYVGCGTKYLDIINAGVIGTAYLTLQYTKTTD